MITEYNKDKKISITGKQVFEITKVELVCLATKDRDTNIPLKDGIKKLLSSGFYFSYTYDLTKRLQRSKGDERYWWNKNLYEDFRAHNVSPGWALQTIQGFVGYSKEVLDKSTMELCLISRRRFEMAGTRFSR